MVDSCLLGPIDDDLFHWQASIIDPSDTSYSGSIFYLDIHLPSVIIQTNKGIQYDSRSKFHVNVLP
uniref:Uncharacterized protein n=1 Tax=Rhizophagus irregularis (strain DAOM 181602 / DAOM 197198 / MUCL 43194) TaxID=747089 RepID=U9UTB8_RHIID